MVLGRYLGPSIDVGPAMSAKILKANGAVVHRSTYRPLTLEEQSLPDEIKEREAFDQAILAKLGPKMDPSDPVLEDAETPHYDLYSDDSGESHSHATEAEDVTPEVADQYLNAEVLLPRNGKMLTGKVKQRKRD